MLNLISFGGGRIMNFRHKYDGSALAIGLLTSTMNIYGLVGYVRKKMN